MDLSRISLDELRGLQQQVANAIKAREAEDIRRAREKILAIAQGIGLSIDDLKSWTKAATGKPRAPSTKVYQDPANPENRWLGRGPHPAWLKAGLSSGKGFDHFLVA